MRIKCAIIYGEESDQHHVLMDSAKDYFDKVLAVPMDSLRVVYNEEGIKIMYKTTDLTDFDCVFLRVFGNEMLFGENIPEILETEGVYTQVDVDSLTIASNKFYMIKVMEDGDLPVPKTSYTLSTTETERAAESLNYPVIIKIISGYGGKGVMKANQKSDLTPIIDTLALFEQDICLQEYIENPGEDIRIIIIGDQTYAYKRIGGREEFRSNISAGGKREPYELSEEMEEVAVKAAKICGFDFCGIDIIEGQENGDFFIGEVNASPGIAGTEEVIEEPIADLLMEYLYEQTLKKKTETKKRFKKETKEKKESED